MSDDVEKLEEIFDATGAARQLRFGPLDLTDISDDDLTKIRRGLRRAEIDFGFGAQRIAREINKRHRMKK